MSLPKVVLLTKPGFRQTGMSRGLLWLWLALDTVVRSGAVAGCPSKLVLTAGSNSHASGGHVLPRCDALDAQSKLFVDTDHRHAADHKRHFVSEVLLEAQGSLGPASILRVWDDRRQLVTADFYGWLEDEGTPNEHFHFQVRKGHTIRL